MDVSARPGDRSQEPGLERSTGAVEMGPSLARDRLLRHRRALVLSAIALLDWAGLVAITHVVGARLVQREPRTRIFAAPLVAHFDPHLHPAALLPVAEAALALAFAFGLSARIGWRRLLLLTFFAAGVWAVSLALMDGVSELTRPLLGPNDYLHDVPLVGSPGAFLSHFVERIGEYHQHVRAHPPGMVLLLWAMDHVGLAGRGWEAVLEIAGGAAMVPAALISLKEVAGERQARAAAPFVAFAPAVIWVATTGDAFFAGVSTWAVTLVILSIRRSGRRSDALALGGGILFGAALMLSYGLAILAIIPLIVAIRYRRVRPLMVAATGAGAVLLAFAAAGFWWIAGYQATIVQYRASIARLRPQSYFWYGDLGAFAIVLGPATAVALIRLRNRSTWLLVAGGLLAVAIADATGFSKAEVERIWLPFVPWILLASAALVGSRSNPFSTLSARAWLALTMGSGLAIQLLLLTTW